jgi:hypothetical protein
MHVAPFIGPVRQTGTSGEGCYLRRGAGRDMLRVRRPRAAQSSSGLAGHFREIGSTLVQGTGVAGTG